MNERDKNYINLNLYLWKILSKLDAASLAIAIKKFIALYRYSYYYFLTLLFFVLNTNRIEFSNFCSFFS